MARKRRDLTPQEAELWSQVAKTTKSLRPTPEIPEARAAPKTLREKVTPPREAAYAPPPFTLGQSRVSSASAALIRTEVASERQGALRIDSKTHKRLKQGKLRPEARIDMHGMTLAIAQPALINFILSSQARGLRLVLVITGKGRGDMGPLPTRHGALRFNVPYWLKQRPLAQLVNHVSAAHFRHGGEGAYYVYLRK